MNRHSRTIAVALMLLCGCRSPWAGLLRKPEAEQLPGLSRNGVDPLASESPIASAATSPQGRSTDALLQRADRELQRGELETAKNMYRQVLSVKADHPVAHHRLAIVADRQNDFASANFHYEFARRSKGDDPDLLNDMGYSYYLQGNYRESERLLRQALEIKPTHRDALNNLGQLYAIQGKQADADSLLRLANSESEPNAAAVQSSMNAIPPVGVARIGSNLLGAPLYAPELRPGTRTAAVERRELAQASPQANVDDATTQPRARITDIEPTEPIEHAAPTQSPKPRQADNTQWNRISTVSAAITEPEPASGYTRAANKVDPLDSMAAWPPAESPTTTQPTLPHAQLTSIEPAAYVAPPAPAGYGHPQRPSKPQHPQAAPNALPTTITVEHPSRSFRDPW